MNFEWNEEKRIANIDKHGLDFLDADILFANPLLECLSKPARLSRLTSVFEHRSGAALRAVSTGAQQSGVRRPA